MILPAGYLGGLVYAPQPRKAFFMGALIPTIFVLLASQSAPFAICEQWMVAAYSRFRGSPDPFARALESGYFLNQLFQLVLSLVCGGVCMAVAAASKKGAA
jgi:hypothetical protein